MSRKSRLRALKAKQLTAQKEYENYENELKEQAREGKRSRAAVKYEKKGKKELLRKEPLFVKALRFVMLLPYAVNGLFLGTITVIAILFLDLDMPNSKAYFILASDVLLTAGLILTFMKKYIPAFGFNAVGTGLFVSVGVSFVSRIQKHMETHHVDPENANMDVKYMLYFYPMLILGICSAVLLAYTIIKTVNRKKRERERFNNMPVKSIIDD
ncbi:MAG: hypothetical protein J6A55_07020 [Oscillospiraceae bacterium]|nr:hypothetical protein [Oscillospiraceae bacterium]